MTSGLLSIINYIRALSKTALSANDKEKNNYLSEIHKITKSLTNVYIQTGICPDKTPSEIAEWLHKETI